jgi:hypothetical protein
MKAWPRGNAMTLALTLSAELEERLHLEAARRGESAEAVALQLLKQHLPQSVAERRAAAVAMLHCWMEEDVSLDPVEVAANADLLRSLDADRPSHRKLFNDILKDDRP